MDEPLIGTIVLWAVPWVPRGWFFCQGQLLSIMEYQALFALIGTTYGGDGRTNFALPDLRGAVPIGTGNGPLGNFQVGQKGGNGVSTVALTTNNLPAHTHGMSGATAEIPETALDLTMTVSTDNGQVTAPSSGAYLGAVNDTSRPCYLYRSDAVNSTNLAGVTGSLPAQEVSVNGSVSATGLGQPFQVSNMQPYVAMNYIIAYEGLFPQRP